ncbi:hypothetical protein ACFFX1_38725 [Dactylosporangium sucinum]|uniref:Uncharacterized protein n=1 Tax=Dactylosporangium sucinum TaxID=1424081 RepID=A0A917WHL3_9ACTN|nr:hypothetical protein [Dactylosporangium sucinum]GGM04637.1 hypothetical protein GCM10007977_002320 [Dactylosporangium sucinum]
MVKHRTALHDAHRVLGATFITFAGWKMPLRYSSELLEHHAVRTNHVDVDVVAMPFVRR